MDTSEIQFLQLLFLVSILNLSLFVYLPHLRRSPELSLCDPLQNMAVVPSPPSIDQAGNTRLWRALKQNFS